MTQEDYKDAVRLCREKIGKAKAQLELRLATTFKDNEKCCYKYISGKRRAREKHPPLLDVEGNLAMKDEEKAEVLNAFFASVFNSQTGHPQGCQAPVLGDGASMQNEVPVVEEVAVTNRAPQPGCSQVHGAGWDTPEDTEGAGRGDAGDGCPSFISSHVNRGGPR